MKTGTRPEVCRSGMMRDSDDDLHFLDDIPDDADDYEVERTESDEDEGCEGGACKI